MARTETQIVKNAFNLGFSIITAFGCKNNCSYCIWKNFHELRNKKTSFNSTDWKKLESLIRVYPNKKINVSGGLDPLFDYQNNKQYWNKLFCIAKSNQKLVDVHTREFIFENELLSNVNKLVISFDELDKVKENLLRYPKNTKIRLVKVITSKTDLQEAEKIIKFSYKNKFQVTFKELYGFKDNDQFLKLKNQLVALYDFEKWNIRFLENKDFNIYFMPDNKIHTKYINN